MISCAFIYLFGGAVLLTRLLRLPLDLFALSSLRGLLCEGADKDQGGGDWKVPGELKCLIYRNTNCSADQFYHNEEWLILILYCLDVLKHNGIQ